MKKEITPDAKVQAAIAERQLYVEKLSKTDEKIRALRDYHQAQLDALNGTTAPVAPESPPPVTAPPLPPKPPLLPKPPLPTKPTDPSRVVGRISESDKAAYKGKIILRKHSGVRHDPKKLAWSMVHQFLGDRAILTTIDPFTTREIDAVVAAECTKYGIAPPRTSVSSIISFWMEEGRIKKVGSKKLPIRGSKRTVRAYVYEVCDGQAFHPKDACWHLPRIKLREANAPQELLQEITRKAAKNPVEEDEEV